MMDIQSHDGKISDEKEKRNSSKIPKTEKKIYQYIFSDLKIRLSPNFSLATLDAKNYTTQCFKAMRLNFLETRILELIQSKFK